MLSPFPLFLIVTFIVQVHADYTDPHCQNRQVIVELFEWKWSDVAEECERFLSKQGYCGVQISPVAEHAVINDHMRPWWERYQPVSYELTSRGGNETQLRDMVDRCNKVGVRIYVDVVINNMASLGRSGLGSGGDPFDADAYDFPAVPYKREHFNPRSKCSSSSGNVDNYGDPNNIRYCSVDGHTDLDQNLEYVRDKITAFLNKLVDIGVSGFRVDSAEHMWPDDLSVIQKRLKDLPGGGRPFFYHEVNEIKDRGVLPTEYFNLGYVSEYRYGRSIASSTADFTSFTNITDGLMDPQHSLVFVDSHLTQRTDGAGEVITFKTPREYKMAHAFTLAFNYGFVRVMSSYDFTDISEGPPHKQDFTAKDVTVDANGTCANGWICEHRWKPIVNMVAFRNAVEGSDVRHWFNNGSVLAFARGNKGFFVMSKLGKLNQQFTTDLPAGEYCDIIHDCRQKVKVDSGGLVNINIDDTEEPMVALLDDGSHNTTKAIQTTSTSTSTAPSTATDSASGSTQTSSSIPYTSTQTVSSVTLSSGSSITPLIDSSKIYSSTPSVASVTSQTSMPPSTDENVKITSPVSEALTKQFTTSRTATASTLLQTSTTFLQTSTTPTSSTKSTNTVLTVTSPVPNTHDSTTSIFTPPTNRVSGSSNIKTTVPSPVSTVPHNTLTNVLSSNQPASTKLNSGNIATSITPVASSTPNMLSTGNIQRTSTNLMSSSGSKATATSTITSSSILNTKGARLTSVSTPLPAVTTQGFSITPPVSNTVPSVSNTQGTSPSTNTKHSASSSNSHRITVTNTLGISPFSHTVTSPLHSERSPSVSNTQGASSFPSTQVSSTTTKGFSSTVPGSVSSGVSSTSSLSNLPVTSSANTGGSTSSSTVPGSVSSGVSSTSSPSNLPVTSSANTGGSTSSSTVPSSSSLTPSSWQRTVILIQKHTRNGEDVFINGGIDHDHRSGCLTQVYSNPCAIPIRHRPLGTGLHYDAYNAWSSGDNYLDWYGAEPGQGSFKGRPAEGTPTLWTTNNPNKPEYNSLNSYGEHYWLMDVDMDCSKTSGGFFEFKGDVNGGWEGHVTGRICSGNGSATPPYSSENHMARCGYINVFHWGTGSCEIHAFNAPTTTTIVVSPITSGTITTGQILSSVQNVNPSSTSVPLTRSSLSTPSPSTSTTATTSTTISTTTTPSPWQRTVILLEFRSHSGQDVFIKGGIDHAHRIGCSTQVFSNPCAIPIRHRPLGTGSHYDAYNAWSSGDNYLDWYGAEPGQGSFKGRPAEGTPALWTTNNRNRPEYNSLNSYGEHYWLMDVDMDCSKTSGGFFEFKGDVNGGWEGHVTGSKCSGTGSATPPYSSENHMARCGYINVFHWGTGSCEINPF